MLPLFSFLLCALLLPLTVSQAAPALEEISEQEKVIHVLNRLGFGPRPGDVGRVRAMGVEAFIRQQLYPENLPDWDLRERLAEFEVLNMSSRELVELLPSRSKRGKAGSRQDARQGSDSSDSSTMDSAEMQQMEQQRKESQRALRKVQREFAQAKVVRAVYSERQLQEVLVDFWMNHFNIFMAKGLDRVLISDFEQHVIRPRTLGKFEDLLMATAKSPAMLFYLDNWLSSAPADVMEKRIADLKKKLSSAGRSRWGRDRAQSAEPRLQGAMRILGRAKGLNENYARELMELHTLGVDGGYTQEDVVEVARCLTGWTIQDPRKGPAFRFQFVLHEEGDKVVLGHAIQSSGVKEGERVIRILAHHPSTARFISSKLIRRLVADDPPADLLNAASRTFEQTGGDIREVLKTIFTHPHFFSRKVYQAKLKKPFELVVSSLRAVEAEVGTSPYLLKTLSEMGEALYLCQEPTGYPDVASAWINTNSLLQRLNFALVLSANRVRGVEVNLSSAQPLFRELGLSEPDSRQAQQTRSLLDDVERGGRSPGRVRVDGLVIQSAFMLGSPQFQKR